MPSGLSPSSLELWLQCPRKFREEKVEGRSGGTGEAALMGTFVHLVLERLMELEPSERTPRSARAIALREWPEWSAPGGELAGWLDGEGAGTDVVAMRRRAWASVAGYFQTEEPRDVEVVATERWLSAEVDGVPLRGIVDRLDRDVFGDLVVVDYKTGKVPAPRFRSAKFRQLNLYAALIEEVDGERPSEGRLVFTSFGEVVSTEVTAESSARAVGVAADAWAAIGRAEESGEWPAEPGPLCGWCPFLSECEEGAAEVRSRAASGRLRRDAPGWSVVEPDA